MGNKVCRRFKLTAAGRRCAKFDSGSYSRHKKQRVSKTCKRFKTTTQGRRCAEYKGD